MAQRHNLAGGWDLGNAPQPATLLAAFCIAAALGLVQSASFGSIAQLDPDPAGRTRAAGAIAQPRNPGSTSGTPLLVWLIAAEGINGLVLFLALFSAIGIALHAVQARRRARA